jgi:excisionase family DNA binding protein
MAIKFPDEINPKNIDESRSLKLRFEYSYRAIQYLDYFGIISIIEHTYIPLNMKFDDNKTLYGFLYDVGIVYDEITVSEAFSYLSDTVSIVDTGKIQMKDEDLSSAVLQHKFYSVNEIAEMLSFSRPTVYKLINEGKVKATRLNNQLRIKHSDYINYITTDPLQ